MAKVVRFRRNCGHKFAHHERLLFVLQCSLKQARKRKVQASHTAGRIIEDLEFLEKVLKFSFSWDGVPMAFFFGDVSAELGAYLKHKKILSLGAFLSHPADIVSQELRNIGASYPPSVQKLWTGLNTRLTER